MKIFKNVTLNALGASEFTNHVTKYSYMEFKDEQGNIIPFHGDVLVSSYMGANFNTGGHGDFYIFKGHAGMILQATKINGEKRCIGLATSMNTWGCMAFWDAGLLPSFFLHFVSFGLYMLFCIFYAMYYSKRRVKAVQALKKEGYNIS